MNILHRRMDVLNNAIMLQRHTAIQRLLARLAVEGSTRFRAAPVRQKTNSTSRRVGCGIFNTCDVFIADEHQVSTDDIVRGVCYGCMLSYSHRLSLAYLAHNKRFPQ